MPKVTASRSIASTGGYIQFTGAEWRAVVRFAAAHAFTPVDAVRWLVALELAERDDPSDAMLRKHAFS